MNEAVMNTFVQRDISKHKAAQKLMFYPEIDTRTREPLNNGSTNKRTHTNEYDICNTCVHTFIE